MQQYRSRYDTNFAPTTTRAAPMDIRSYFHSEFAEHAAVLAATRDALGESFERLVAVCIAALKAGNKLMFFGNGGSAAGPPDRCCYCIMPCRIPGIRREE